MCSECTCVSLTRCQGWPTGQLNTTAQCICQKISLGLSSVSFNVVLVLCEAVEISLAHRQGNAFDGSPPLVLDIFENSSTSSHHAGPNGYDITRFISSHIFWMISKHFPNDGRILIPLFWVPNEYEVITQAMRRLKWPMGISSEFLSYSVTTERWPLTFYDLHDWKWGLILQ